MKVQDYAKLHLVRLMSDISEDLYCAGWISGLETSLWLMMHQTRTRADENSAL